MPPGSLVLIVHAHQPVGNFDDAFAWCHERAYAPLLRLLERRSELRLALHASGPLLEWLAASQPAEIPRLRALVRRAQVEPWGGGFFEPVLHAIPERDRRGQVRAMADWIERHLGRRPAGAWIAEGEWEPGLATSLACGGASYTALDRRRFDALGLEAAARRGAYRTEDQGHALGLLPVDGALSAMIPFEDPGRFVERLNAAAAAGGDTVTLAIAAEQLGAWPGTDARCWEARWFDGFLDALAEDGGLRLRLPAEVIAEHARDEITYVPGELRHFPAATPGARRLHLRMVRASERLDTDARRGGPDWLEARTRLWRAQCGDAYGFGAASGHERPHLRAAVHRERIAVERFLAPPEPRVETADLDLDGDDDVALVSPAWSVWCSLRGARVWGLDDHAHGVDWADAADPAGGGLFEDVWIEGPLRREFASELWSAEAPSPASVVLRSPRGGDPSLEKRFTLGSDGALEVEYVLRSGRPKLGKLEIRMRLGLHVPDAPDRYVEIDGTRAVPAHFAAAARHEGIARSAYVDDWAACRLDVWTDRRGALSRAPIESEARGGAAGEKLFQGIDARYVFAAAIESGKPWRLHVRLAPTRARVTA